jgi:hypothetical protein
MENFKKLNEREKEIIEDVYCKIQEMIEYEGDQFISLAESVLELIYGKEKSEIVKESIEKFEIRDIEFTFWEQIESNKELKEIFLYKK